MIDQLIKDFSASIKAEKIKLIVQNLREYQPGLVFGKLYNQEVKDMLMNTPPEKLFHPEKVHDRNFAKAVVSGFLIWNDCEDEAHSLAQNIPIAEGSYFHAIIHRREPDIWNSGYWFKRTGDHPVYSLIYDYVAEYSSDKLKRILLLKNKWDPEVFNKIIEDAQKNGNMNDKELTEIQHAEILFLIAHSYRHSLG